MKILNDTKTEDTLKSLRLSPDKEWSNKVEQELKDFTLSDQKDYSIINFLKTKFMKNKVIVAGVFVIAALVVLISISSIILITRLNQSTQNLTEAQKLEILSKVIANNSGSSIKSSAGVAESSPMANDAARSASSLSLLPYIDESFKDNNYKYTKSTITPGAAYEKCSDTYDYETLNSISESLEYHPNGGSDYTTFKYKNINYTSNKDLTNYNLSYFENGNSINYDYAGGNYAVKNIYEQGPLATRETLMDNVSTGSADSSSDSTASNTPSSGDNGSATSDLIKQYFGSDVEIISTEEVNGETYYTIRYSFNSFCKNQNAKLIYQNKVNGTTFQINQTQTYIDTVSDNNLISTYTYIVERNNLSEEESAKAFRFEYSVPVKEVVYKYVPAEDYSAEREASKNLEILKNTSTNMLVPVDSSYSLIYGYTYQDTGVVPAGSDYRSDRNFYPGNTLGESIYNLYNPQSNLITINTESNFSFSSTDSNKLDIYIESYPTGTTKEDIIKLKTQYFTEIKNKTSDTVQIKINGEKLFATNLRFTASVNNVLYKDAISSSSAGSAVTMDSPDESRLIAPDSSTETDYSFIIFEFKGHFYAVNAYSNGKISADDINFKSYDPSLQIDSAYIKGELLKVYDVNKPIPVEDGIGDGNSGSEVPPTGIACTQEAKQCPDGSYVGRNSANNCEFDACP